MIESMNKKEIKEFVNEYDLMMELEIMEITAGYAFDDEELRFEKSMKSLIDEHVDYESSFIELAEEDIQKSDEINHQVMRLESSPSKEIYHGCHDFIAEMDSELYDDFEFMHALEEKLAIENQEFNEYVNEHELIAEYEGYEITDGYAFDEDELQFEESMGKLIEEQEFYESRFLESSLLDMEKSEEFDIQIECHEMDEIDYQDYEEFFDYDWDDESYDYDPEEEYFFEEIDMDGAYIGGELCGYVADNDPFDSLDGDRLENYWN